MELTKIRFRNAIWEGRLSNVAETDTAPQIEVRHLDQIVADVTVVKEDIGADWTLRIPLPPEAIADGVQTFLIQDMTRGTRLGSFTLIAGDPVGDDIRAEVELLRAELDMLKRAFRRHCVQTQ